jgi:bisphosphoglycerate-independent phosphoglycerate mutase (AlkP superfamily)
VFFKDVAGNPPSKTNAYCVAHSKPYSSFAADLAANNLADYVFITPNLCNDMHGATGCPNSNTIQAGDAWLQAELPRIITWANTHSAVIFLTWDEGSSTSKIPYAGTLSYTHSSIVKSVEEILGLPILATVSTANDLADLFNPGFFP